MTSRLARVSGDVTVSTGSGGSRFRCASRTPRPHPSRRRCGWCDARRPELHPAPAPAPTPASSLALSGGDWRDCGCRDQLGASFQRRIDHPVDKDTAVDPVSWVGRDRERLWSHFPCSLSTNHVGVGLKSLVCNVKSQIHVATFLRNREQS